MTYLQTEFQRSGIFLLPIRIFMGLAWIRVGLEKLFDPRWHSGEELRLFFQEQLQNGDVVFPFYQSLIQSTFEPAAGAMSGIILFAELYVGFAILFGCFTNLALIGGIFMNLNFMLAGSANPSIFYILIQAVLLGTNSGAVFGFDRSLSSRVRSWFLVAQPDYSLRHLAMHPLFFFATSGLAFGSGLLCMAYVQDKSLKRPDDPALALSALCLVTGITLCILAIRSYNTRAGRAAAISPTNSPVFGSPMSGSPVSGSPIFGSPMPGSPVLGSPADREMQSGIHIDPQMSVNDFATILVPHNIADTAKRDVSSDVSRNASQNASQNMSRDMRRDSTRERNRNKPVASGHRAARVVSKPVLKPVAKHAPNLGVTTIQNTINEMSTMLIPHNMSDKGVREPDTSSNGFQKVYI